jgi:SAM-dependent methyltransferase
MQSIRLFWFKLSNAGSRKFECPVCGYWGPFRELSRPTGRRKHAQCPQCDALERHRLQYLVIDRVLSEIDPQKLRMLHFAPEPFFRGFFSARFAEYVTADAHMEGVDHRVDLQHLPFADAYYDFIFASHVLEHISDDAAALAEIRRVLSPGGIAILPVPLVADRTVEYEKPNPHESGHVRAPGPDYFDRYRNYFSRVELVASDVFPEKFQLFVHEDRSTWPTHECPQRPAMRGEKHVDIVPVCHV